MRGEWREVRDRRAMTVVEFASEMAKKAWNGTAANISASRAMCGRRTGEWSTPMTDQYRR